MVSMSNINHNGPNTQNSSITNKIPPEILRNASDAIVRATRIRKSADSGLPLDLVGIKLGEGAYNEIFMLSSVRSLRDS